MAEVQVGFLYKAAYALPNTEKDKNLKLLKSYYLMRCRAVTKGYSLPNKQFSPKVRCSHCCSEWTTATPTTLKPLKLSKKQRRRIRTEKSKNKDYLKSRLDLLHSNTMEQTCTFCKHTTKTNLLKPEKEREKPDKVKEVKTNVKAEVKAKPKKDEIKANTNTGKKKTVEVNVYSIAKDVFSLNNDKNTLASAKKEQPRVIKNNKKKKDKFAGLCQKAVLATAKLKQGQDKQKKLNLFLRPSTST